MANKTVGDLTAASSVAAADLVHVVQGGNSRKATIQQVIDADTTLSALAAYNTNGLLTQTATDTFAGRTIIAPAAGVTVSNGDGVSGNPTLALANDLAALEALSGTNTIYYRSGADTWSAVTVGAMLSFSGGTLNTSEAVAVTVADRTALAALTSVNVAYLRESGREGLFKWDSSNLSTQVSADTAQGIYVAPSSDATGASGAWVRQFVGPVNPLWFGVVDGNASGSNGAANSTALSAMFATLRTRASNIETDYQGLEAVRFPAGFFEFASTIEITDGTFIFEGVDTGAPAGRGSKLKFPSGVTGIRTQRYNTSGADTTDATTHRGGDGTVIRNLSLIGAYTTTEAEAHGIHLRSRARIESVFIDQFEGDGIYSTATAGGGANEGNANNAFIMHSRIQRCRSGISVDGADANIWSIIGVDCSSNRQWGTYDSSFLGNTYVGCHTASNGLIDGTTPTVVTNSGNRYGCINGQESGASTNAPSGTTADNTWWYYIGAGGASSGNNIDEWLSGTTYRAGGAHLTDNANARSVFDGCYYESGQGFAQIVAPTLVLGGTLAGNTYGTGGTLRTNTSGYLQTNRAFFFERADTTSTRRVQMGEGTTTKTLLYLYDSVAAPLVHRLKYDSNELTLDYQNSALLRTFAITGPASTQQFGSAAAIAHAFYPYKLKVGDSLANARHLSNATAAPTAESPGSFYINRTPAVGDPAAWIGITAGVAAEPVGIVGATQVAAAADLTSAATVGTLPTADGSITIADAATPTVQELLEYCRELEAQVETLKANMRTSRVLAT